MALDETKVGYNHKIHVLADPLIAPASKNEWTHEVQSCSFH